MLKNKIKTNPKESDKINPQISVVILNYNAGDLLIDCISSIQKWLLMRLKSVRWPIMLTTWV